MSLRNTFGPAKGKLNIVLEGMSDCIYMHTMAKTLGYDLSKYSFIPSVGATNCINTCNILYGWGCPFCAVFDYDNEGVTKGGEVLQNKFEYELGKQYIYIKPVTQKDVTDKTYKDSPCRIEDIVTRDELDKFIKSSSAKKNDSKTLIAKLFSDAIETGSHTVGSECEESFRNLLERITAINK